MSTRDTALAAPPDRLWETMSNDASAQIVTIVSVTPEGTPEVRPVAGGPVVPARLAVPATRARIDAAIENRQQAVVVFEGGDLSKPIVIAFIAPIETEAPAAEPEPSPAPHIIEADVDGKARSSDRSGRDRAAVRQRVDYAAPQRTRRRSRNLRRNALGRNKPNQGGTGSDQLNRRNPGMSPQNATTPFRDLVDESFDEAAFLWRRWESELASLTRNLDEIYSWTEDRLQGALDGVRVGGAVAIDIATEALRSDDIDRATAGAALLASSADPKATDALVAELGTAKDARLRAIVRSLEVAGSDHALRAAARLLANGDPVHAGALCRLKVFRRARPAEEITAAFASNVPDLQAEALHAARLSTDGKADKIVSAGLSHADAAVRYAAVESGLSLRINGAKETAITMAGQRHPAAGRCLNLVALFGTADDREIVYDALRIPGQQLAAVWALGHIGTVRAVDACVAGMKHDALARACGEAYCWITGANLERDRLAIQETPPEVPAFEDDDLDANLVPPPEALWPIPDAEAVRKHWLALRSEWQEEVRHIQGRRSNGETLLTTIETGPMLRRPDLILELRVKTRGRYDVEPRAFTQRQRQMMSASRAAVLNQTGS